MKVHFSALLMTLILSVSVVYGQTLDERINQFKSASKPDLQGEAYVRWNQYMVPYIFADTDRDAAYLLGMVHAHLRLGQMEIAKRAAYGRISEMAGPATRDVDKAIRTLGFSSASGLILERMPAETKIWLSAYVDGINYYRTAVSERPPEFKTLNLKEERWLVEDIITLGRLFGSDFTWFMLPDLISMRGTQEWEKIKTAFVSKIDMSTLSAYSQQPKTKNPRVNVDQKFFHKLLENHARLGSNSFVISPERSRSGSAMIANDPHLGLKLPNIWLLAGIHSPSFKAVGATSPGLPVIAFGRTDCLAWGGTNLHSWATDIIELTDEEAETAFSDKLDINTRFWFNGSLERKVTQYGPIVSEIDYFGFPEGQHFAAKWVGHLPSDEFSSMLNLLKLSDGRKMAEALSGFAIPGQNMLYADCKGNIGHVVATWLPKRPTAFPDDVIIDSEIANKRWTHILTAKNLPQRHNPEQGYLVSSNDESFFHSSTRIGLTYSPKLRAERISTLIESADKLSIKELSMIQRDVYNQAAHDLAKDIATIGLSISEEFFTRLKNWNGHYKMTSEGALVYEAMVYHLAKPVFEAADGKDYTELWLKSGYFDIELGKAFNTLPVEKKRVLVQQAFDKAKSEAKPGERWGDRHKLNSDHVLSNVPLLGKKYKGDTYAGSGGRETVMKSGNDLDIDEHSPSFGSQSRHISDMAHPDSNFFVLYGGQDGWLNSQNYADQISMWQGMEYIQLPLTIKEVEKQFPIVVHYKARIDNSR